jgi:hypothetical protein
MTNQIAAARPVSAAIRCLREIWRRSNLRSAVIPLKKSLISGRLFEASV